jgi:hypothetical protein
MLDITSQLCYNINVNKREVISMKTNNNRLDDLLSYTNNEVESDLGRG